MLILNRKIGESIVIGDDVFFTIVRIKGNQVGIGFDAPGSLPIHRYEIYQKNQFEKQTGIADQSRKFSPSLHQSNDTYFKREANHVINSI